MTSFGNDIGKTLFVLEQGRHQIGVNIGAFFLPIAA
jgi:hypothetical protein